MVKIIKRIPLASCNLSARKLALILNIVSKDNLPALWDCLFHFPVRCLRVPKWNCRRKSLPFVTNQLIEEDKDPHPVQAAPEQPCKRSQQPMKRLTAQISAKLAEGDFKGAARLVTVEDSIADLNEKILASLRDKHSARHPNSTFPAVPPYVSAIEVSEKRSLGPSFPSRVARQVARMGCIPSI